MPRLKRKSIEQRGRIVRKAMKNLRANSKFHKTEVNRNTLAHQRRRAVENIRLQERKVDKVLRRNRRKKEDIRAQERAKDKVSRQAKRKIENVRKSERIKDRIARESRRNISSVRASERVKDQIARKSKRNIPSVRESERVRDQLARKSKRNIPSVRESERVRDQLARKSKRNVPSVRESERIKNSISHQLRRSNENLRRSERIADKTARRLARESPTVRRSEQIRNTLSHARVRLNPIRRQQEFSRISENQTLQRRDMEWEKLSAAFQKEIRKAPKYPCSCCDLLFYKEYISSISREQLEAKSLSDQFLDEVICKNPDNLQFCRTCKTKILKAQIPKLCLSNGLEFPVKPPELEQLTALEERLVALRIPFAQIKAVGSERQFKLKGNIVNVENDLDVCAKAIPRRFDEMLTLQVKFQRRMSDERPVWYETIRPAVVERAKNFLMTTELYMENNVESREDFVDYAADDNIEFIVPDIEGNNARSTATQQPVEMRNAEENEWEDDEILEAAIADETLIFNQLGSNGITIAPGEGKTPLPLWADPHADEMAHPKIYCGQKRKIIDGVKLTYTDIAKSECLRRDRRCAGPQKVLYAFKKSFNEKMRQAVQIYLRKRRGNRNITAKEALQKEFVQNIIKNDEGYTVWKNLRSSPAYLAHRSKELISMVRQVGTCSLFITFSAAETKWNELLVTLKELLKNEIITENDAASLSSNEKAELIRSDPITCMRHFDRRILKLHTILLKKDKGVFAPHKLTDWFRRTEFQMRGSPHSHGLYWLKDAPKYNPDCPETLAKCIEFIDQYITVEKCTDGKMKDLINRQIHCHSDTCKIIKGKKQCRFGYPLPALPRTMILSPLPADTTKERAKELRELYKKIQNDLTQRKKSVTDEITFTEFLQALGTSEINYIDAVRSSIKRVTVFHKREVNAAYVNRYNRKLLEEWEANMDIQFVIDAYACAKYCVSYILKSDTGMSKMMKEANKKANGNEEIQQKLKAFAKILLRGTEISAQEAAGFLLGINNTHCSRQAIYINTAPPDERTTMLKSDKELAALDENSEDICQKGLLDRYCNRPLEFEDLCLAEFASFFEFEKRNRAANQNQNDEEEANDYEQENEAESEDEAESTRKFPRYPLIDHSGFIRRRTQRKIIRFRNYSRRKDPQNYWREQLMLFVPWRNEDLELLSVDNVQFGELFRQEIIENSKYFYSDRTLGDEELQDIVNDVQNQDDEENTQDNPLAQDEDYLAECVVNPNNQQRSNTSKVEKFLPPNMIPDDEYLRLMRSLNEKQRKIVFDILHRLKTSKDPFCTFLSGGAGVGKSHAITAIVQSTLRYFGSQPSHDPMQAPVVVMAFTGKAAFNVLGMTIHHTLSLLPNQKRYEKLNDLDPSKLNSLRKNLGGLKLIIIDEISMVSVRMLFEIDQRLRQILGIDQPFGGVPVLVVGHLRQLSPIAAPFVFADPTHLPLGAAVGNYLWKELFTFYELTEIMRQKGDAKFCKALNNMSEGCMDEEDIALLKAREISNALTPPDEAVWLFKTNEECSAHNSRVHSDLDTEGAMSTAKDYVEGNGTDTAKQLLLDTAKKWTVSECDGLRYETFLKVRGEYFISTNIDVADGLFNGATGTLRAIEYKQRTEENAPVIPVRVWIDFKNPLIGAKKRQLAKALIDRRAQQNINYRQWVPVERIKKPLTKSYMYEGLQVIRSQIPLVACNGMTVAKSQGSTMPCVVVSIRGVGRRKLTRQELYVACSRATSINGLFINGIFEPPSFPGENDAVTKEMTRIRKKPYTFSLNFLQDIQPSNYKFYFHNVQSLRSHLQDALADTCVTSADLITFMEPHLLETDQFSFPGYEVLHRTNCRGLRRKRRLAIRNSEGAIVLKKDGLATATAGAIKEYSNEGHVILVTVKFGGLTFVVMYKSPKFPKTRFKQILELFLTTTNTDVVYIGDINLDLNKEENNDIVDMFELYGLTSQLDLGSVSTNLGTHIDVCFSNALNVQCWFYESYYSYHKPICVIWPKF